MTNFYPHRQYIFTLWEFRRCQQFSQGSIAHYACLEKSFKKFVFSNGRLEKKNNNKTTQKIKVNNKSMGSGGIIKQINYLPCKQQTHVWSCIFPANILGLLKCSAQVHWGICSFELSDVVKATHILCSIHHRMLLISA